MRKGFDGLAAAVQERLAQDPSRVIFSCFAAVGLQPTGLTRGAAIF
jgi:hypothetical protein